MLLETITLHNFRMFESLEVHFGSPLSVLVGGNGSGKSTVLDAATIAVGTLTAAMDGLTNYTISRTDAHLKCFSMGSGVDVQPQYPVEISAEGTLDGRRIRWSRSLNSAGGRCGLGGAKEMTAVSCSYRDRMREGDTGLILPVVSYYGTGRLWAQHREKRNEPFENSTRSNGYIDSLDAAANDKLMMKWFQKMTIQQYQQEKPIPEFSAVCRAMEECFRQITGCSEVKVQYNLDTNAVDVIYRDRDGEAVRIPMSQMSDGYKCTISLIADIAYRMAVLNPQLLGSVLQETPGIVLIDEVDLHLHPRWQQQILRDLTAIFPRVQFIVSTHAPAVIHSVERESLIILKDHAALSAPDETYGKDVNTIFREIMEVSERPAEITDLFTSFYCSLDAGLYSEAETILTQLEDRIGSSDPEITSCRVQLELEKM